MEVSFQSGDGIMESCSLPCFAVSIHAPSLFFNLSCFLQRENFADGEKQSHRKPARGVGCFWICPGPSPPSTCLQGACSNLHWAEARTSAGAGRQRGAGSPLCWDQLRVMEPLWLRLSFPVGAVRHAQGSVDITERKEGGREWT